MSINSLAFVIFVILAAAVYYLLPGKYQWLWLLAASYIYYFANGRGLVVFLLSTTVTTWYAGILLANETDDRRRRFITAATLILNFGILGVLKYTNFFIFNVNQITRGNISFVSFALPLGISFYTFQSMGYLLDVGWRRQEAERNLLKFALFVSFFPQILQGPIARYSSLAGQLYEEHRVDMARMERACLRILWGFLKKMVIADNALYFVNALFDEFQKYPGLAIFAAGAYSLQLYGDFSGGIDVVIGIGALFGIEMDENFRQPYFAVSISDFWHRWHITLGTWMKDYVFYPISLSGWMDRFKKFCRKRFGKQIARTLPIALANIIVFLVVGIWHGAAWKYIAYGFYNGLIIGVSGMLANVFRDTKKKLGIAKDQVGFHLFQVARTFALVNISWYFDRADTVGQAFAMMRNAVTHFSPAALLTIPVGPGGSTNFTVVAIAIILFGTAVLFAVSLLRERGCDVALRIMQMPAAARLAVYLVMLMALPALGQPPAITGGFIYAQF
ncbi:MAG: MBOAT family O-acyltransferase [Lachnospiraceae bacterium]|nr:MBOAT family O-acyltransferase [Lachnospiraceae bacterium]